MTLNCLKTLIFYHILRNVIINFITKHYETCKTTCGLSILLHGVMSLPDVASCEKTIYKSTTKLFVHGKTG